MLRCTDAIMMTIIDWAQAAEILMLLMLCVCVSRRRKARMCVGN